MNVLTPYPARHIMHMFAYEDCCSSPVQRRDDAAKAMEAMDGVILHSDSHALPPILIPYLPFHTINTHAEAR